MHGLDIHRLESGVERQSGGGDVIVFQALQFVIGDRGVIRRRGGLPVDVRIVIRDDAPRHAVAARMRELNGDEQIVRRTPLLAMQLADAREQPRELRHIVRRNPKLARIGAAVFAHGGSFKPDELGAAAREAFVAAPGQLAGTAIQRPVAAFHRLDGDGVARRSTAPTRTGRASTRRTSSGLAVKRTCAAPASSAARCNSSRVL